MSKRNYELRVQTVCLTILTIVAIAVTLYVVKKVVVPFILAAFLALILIPIVDFLIRKLRIGRPIALFLTLMLGFLVMLGIGSLVSVSVSQFARNAGDYETQLTKLIDKAEQSLPVDKIIALISGASEEAGAVGTLEVLSEAEQGAALDASANETLAVSSPAGGEGSKTRFDAAALLPKGAIQGLAGKLSSAVLSILSNGMLVMLFTAFLLAGSTTRTRQREGVLGEIETRVQKYICIKIVLSLLTGFLVFVVLKVIGVEYALSFGAFAFILNFIPNVGSLVATLLPMPVVLLTPDVSMMMVALAFLLPLSVQFVIGSVLEPKIMGDTLGLHPVVILMALIFWGMLWGFSGMLLAAPLTAIAKIVFERLEVTKPIAGLMGGRLESINEAAKQMEPPK